MMLAPRHRSERLLQRRCAAGLTLMALLFAAQYSWATGPPCTATPDPKTVAGAGGFINSSVWRVCATLPVRFGADMPDAVAVLLRSTKPQGESPGGDLLFGVDLLIINDGKKVYRYSDFAVARKFFVDDYLRAQDLTGQGTNAVLFHSSGEVGISDRWSAMHLVLLPPGESIAMDVADEDFGDSWRHKTRWTTISGIPTVLVAKPIEPAGFENPRRCHSCSKFYQYLVYQWSASRSSFTLRRVIQSERDIDADTDPLDADKAFIDSALAKGLPPLTQK
jgi:hypothetical protein